MHEIWESQSIFQANIRKRPHDFQSMAPTKTVIPWKAWCLVGVRISPPQSLSPLGPSAVLRSRRRRTFLRHWRLPRWALSALRLGGSDHVIRSPRQSPLFPKLLQTGSTAGITACPDACAGLPRRRNAGLKRSQTSANIQGGYRRTRGS